VPDWRPDGLEIAYVTDAGPTATGGDIWVMNADGGDQHAVTSGPKREYGAAWAPDGTQIAYLNFDTRTVEVMNADGSDAHPVRAGGIQFVPGWQPRGTGLDDAGDWNFPPPSTSSVARSPFSTSSVFGRTARPRRAINKRNRSER
jgi:Tol biopolymer transport system component